ncbi:MAG: hypothetical protein JO300_16110 [Silvibacterium sp.]|nr:hypothetical protein [Silvibacterium sp.]
MGTYFLGESADCLRLEDVAAHHGGHFEVIADKTPDKFALGGTSILVAMAKD